MILVDTSAWIEFFREKPSRMKARIEFLIKDNNTACICGIVVQEILQGIKDDRTFHSLKQRLLALPYIDSDTDTYLIAASVFRKLRQKGFSPPTVDCLIAALSIQDKLPLLTLDKHFKQIARHTNLKLADL